MAITMLSSRAFDQDSSQARKAAMDGPVFITDGGEPAHVLLSIEEYRRMTGRLRTIADALAMPDADGITFEAPALRIGAGPADLG